MKRKILAIVVSIIVVLAVCPVLSLPPPVLADAPDIWIKTDGENQITPALTEGTPSFADDEASEFVHPIQWEKTSQTELSFPEVDGVAQALAWVNANVFWLSDDDNYGYSEAWANPEQVLTEKTFNEAVIEYDINGDGDTEDIITGYFGDCEDMAFLLASLLKWHTDEVDEEDQVYVNCGFLLPPDQNFHAWVFWWDASERDWHQLDPTHGTHDHFPYPPAIGTLWLNNEHVFGFLPGYYPGLLPPVGGFDRGDFVKISPEEGGFGDEMNTYAWSVAVFNDDLYVGTSRNQGYLVIAMLFPELLELDGILTKPRDAELYPPEMTSDFLEDMRAEIWRYHDGEWEMVHQAEPREGVGYRIMTTFNGAIYAGVGLWGPGWSGDTLVVTSTSGDLDTWEPVNPAGLAGTNTRAMTVHHGKLYLGTSVGGKAAIFANANPGTESNPGDDWTQVADFTGTVNSDIVSLKSFNGYLYAGTQAWGGFEVWRSKIADPTNPDVLTDGHWKRIVKQGAGDSRNLWGSCMEVFKNHLYVGSISLPVPEYFAETFKGFDLIRMDKDDKWELVVGSYPDFVGMPNDTTPERGIPKSGWPAGFGNPMNFYCWSLQEHDGILYLGTLGASSFLRCVPPDMLAELFGVSVEQVERIQEMLACFAGADLWKTDNGIRWEPVSLNGFDNPNNYGFRAMVSGSLYVGTANPYIGQGCEVWKAALPEGESTDAVGVGQDTYTTGDDVYATGSGFPPNTEVDVYIVGDLAWSDRDPIPDDVSSDGRNRLTTDDYGNLEPENVWPAPLTPGEYDLVFDANRNGRYDDVIDVVDHPDHPGFVVLLPPPVGGEAYPVNKIAVLAPWIGLAILLIGGIGWLSLRRRRAERQA